MHMKNLEAVQPALLDLLPDFFMEEVGSRIAGRFDQRNRASNGHAAGKRVTDSKRSAKVHCCETQCFCHDADPVAVQGVVMMNRACQ